MALLELALLERGNMTAAKPQLQFNAFDLNAYATHPSNRRGTFIPSLSTGSFPAAQASAVSGVIAPSVEVAQNEVPTVWDNLPRVGIIQNTTNAPSAQAAPWVRISPCVAKNFKKSPGLGLLSHTAG